MNTINHISLYSPDDIQAMRLADAARLPGQNRINEIIAYAQKAGFTRIGIAHCISLKAEAMVLKELLAPHFEVVDIDCKVGKLPNAAILGDQAKGISCNPAAQALFLAEHKTQLNISVGLCMGHDLIFNQKSVAPVTTLIVKDRQHKHNPYRELSQTTNQNTTEQSVN